MKEENKPMYQTIDEYIALFPESLQQLLNQYRKIIREAIPEASEKISWQMPTFYLKGNVIHFAAQKKHIGIYPGGEAVGIFASELTSYKTSKGAIQIPFNQPIPVDLIQRIAQFSADQNKKRSG